MKGHVFKNIINMLKNNQLKIIEILNAKSIMIFRQPLCVGGLSKGVAMRPGETETCRLLMG
jgi:hypothetical protein